MSKFIDKYQNENIVLNSATTAVIKDDLGIETDFTPEQLDVLRETIDTYGADRAQLVADTAILDDFKTSPEDLRAVAADPFKDGISTAPDAFRDERPGQVEPEQGIDMSKFNVLEQEEIELGLMRGVDVSVYAKKGFDWAEMNEIRQGLEDGLDVSIYAGIDEFGLPEFPYPEQMKEIRLGLKYGLDVSSYANSGFSSGEMREMRIELLQKVEKFEPPTEKQSSLDAEKFGLKWGNTHKRQMVELKDSGYDNPIYGVLQQNEILRGLEAGVDVSAYTAINQHGLPTFDSLQMLEIREGLEAGVDVSQYTKLDHRGRAAFDHIEMGLMRQQLISPQVADKGEGFMNRLKAKFSPEKTSIEGRQSLADVSKNARDASCDLAKDSVKDAPVPGQER